MDIAALKKLAHAANDERWLADSNELGEWFVQVQRYVSNIRLDVAHICQTNGFGEPEAQFIAAANPAAALALIASREQLVEALQGLLSRYVGLVNSGDAGDWDCETEDEVIAARAALASAGAA